jgi:lipopolysaccharide export system protein LptA
MKHLVITVGLTAALLGGAAAARAQGLGTHSGDGPVDITADELEVQNKECVSIWRGKAEALQGQDRLRADVLKAFFETKPGGKGAATTGACGDLLRMEAEGSVYYVTGKDQRVRGDAATYDANNDTVTVTGDVIAVQGQNVLRGRRMVFNTNTGEGHMTGGGTGVNAPNRPRGVIYPKKKDQTEAPSQPGAASGGR